MIEMFNAEGVSCFVDQDQVAVMEDAGWSTEKIDVPVSAEAETDQNAETDQKVDTAKKK